MELDVPVIIVLTMSVTVMVWGPAVSSVAENIPMPPASAVLPGKTALPSVLVKRTVPE
jgi:hypothetical protein